jgi:Nif-specific regulatory protein
LLHNTEILFATLSVLKSFLDMGNGLIALLNEAGDADLVVSSSFCGADAKVYFEALPEKAIGQLVATEVPLAIPDVAQDAVFDWDTAAWGHYAFMGVPVKDRDRVIGTLTIDRPWVKRREVQIDSDIRFLKMVANLVGQTVRLHRIITRDRSRLLEEQTRLAKQRTETPPEAERAAQYGRIIGDSSQIHRVLDTIRIVARTTSTVVLRGESGTGKELFAQAVHDLSTRSKGPFVKLNCAALPEGVMESELFGHEKGALPGRWRCAKAALNWLTEAPCSSTRSARFHPLFRPSCCGSCRKANSSGSVAAER